MDFIAESAKYDVLKNGIFNKNSYQIFLIFYKNNCLISTYNVYKI